MIADIARFGEIARKKSVHYSAVNFEWVPEGPKSLGNAYYLYSITNGKQTIEKTKQNPTIYMVRSNPWLTKNDHGQSKIKVLIQVDAVAASAAIDNYHGVGVITKKYWEKCSQITGGSNPGSYNWKFAGDIFQGYQKRGSMPAINAANQIIGIEIDFQHNAVKYELMNKGKLNQVIASHEGQFDALETDAVCIALGARNLGWKFTFM